MNPVFRNTGADDRSAGGESRRCLSDCSRVAFDRERHRVGYGQGFYDRYLSIHREHITAAVACEWQLVEQAPYEETDILPEYLITDCRIYH